MSANDKAEATYGRGMAGTTRQATDLCGRDKGRTITCYDQPTGDSITGTILGIDHTQDYVYVWVQGRYTAMRLRPEQTVNITGKVVTA